MIPRSLKTMIFIDKIFTSSLQIVLLPTPLGPLITTIIPFDVCRLLIGNVLLHVLDLFFDSVYPALDIHDQMHNLGVAGLAADSVGLSEHLLADKI